MKKQFKATLIALTSLLMGQASAAYDCEQPATEMSGFHNMVVFGKPGTQLYAYHLPLFPGQINGARGHVLMHTYQAIWPITLDDDSAKSYEQTFAQRQSAADMFPFFSLSPRGERFKVPDMICDPEFKTDVLLAYGHVEGNPQFPRPEAITSGLSQITVSAPTTFAIKFDKGVKNDLTYLLFGKDDSYYLVHHLNNNENSYDQIIAVSFGDEAKAKLGALIEAKEVVIPINKDQIEERIDANASTNHNKYKIKALSGGKVAVTFGDDTLEATIIEEIYFNENADLKVN
ncbi:MAG: hypothetical protein HRU19_26825 [Pseudobacteriovorax sp.]|nr:hypothetical protein [Pseudobacteriovorax sp.]